MCFNLIIVFSSPPSFPTGVLASSHGPSHGQLAYSLPAGLSLLALLLALGRARQYRKIKTNNLHATGGYVA